MRLWYVAILAAIVGLSICVASVLRSANVFRSWGLGSAGAYDKASAYRRAGDDDSALSWCEVAIRRDPQWPPPYELRGEIYESRGQLELAAKDYVLAGDLLGYDSIQYVAAGRLYEKLGNVEAAADLYARAVLARGTSIRRLEIVAKLRVGGDDPEALTQLCDFMGKAVKRKPADQHYRQAWLVLDQASSGQGVSND